MKVTGVPRSSCFDMGVPFSTWSTFWSEGYSIENIGLKPSRIIRSIYVLYLNLIPQDLIIVGICGPSSFTFRIPSSMTGSGLLSRYYVKFMLQVVYQFVYPYILLFCGTCSSFLVDDCLRLGVKPQGLDSLCLTFLLINVV